MTTATATKQALRNLLEQNQTANHSSRPTLHTILRHVAKSGMSRDISVKLITSQGHILDVTSMVAEVLNQKLKQRNGYNVITVKGCGMDMGFHIIYNTSRHLYEDTTGTAPDRNQDAGYVIRHEWL